MLILASHILTSPSMTIKTPSFLSNYHTNSASCLESTISRTTFRRAVHIVRNRVALCSVLAMHQADTSLINLNMRLKHRVEVQARQLRAISINLYHIMRWLADWRVPAPR